MALALPPIKVGPVTPVHMEDKGIKAVIVSSLAWFLKDIVVDVRGGLWTKYLKFFSQFSCCRTWSPQNCASPEAQWTHCWQDTKVVSQTLSTRRPRRQRMQWKKKGGRDILITQLKFLYWYSHCCTPSPQHREPILNLNLWPSSESYSVFVCLFHLLYMNMVKKFPLLFFYSSLLWYYVWYSILEIAS